MTTRPRTSLDRVQGRATASEPEIRAMAAEALKAGIILFLRVDLERLPWHAREIIETEARRLYGERT